MISFFRFAFARYSLFLSYVAAFMVGVSLILPYRFAICSLALAIIFGSLSSYLRSPDVRCRYCDSCKNDSVSHSAN